MAGNDPPIVPPPLVPGARVAVIAPSSPFDRALVVRGMGWLSRRYRVSFDRDLFERKGYLAGSDERRLTELDARLRDPTLGAVIVARGGYGLGRIAHRANWAALRTAPKWLVGFSDATVLHVEALAVGVASLHAHNTAGLGRGDTHRRERLRDALEHPMLARTVRGLERWVGGTAEGPLVGGNLTVLFTCLAAGRLRVPSGAVLVLEDVTEQAYRVDRMLTALQVSGALDRVAGVVVGDFTECPPSRGVTVREVLEERLGALGVPVAAGLPFGHELENEPLVLGVRARLDASGGTLETGSLPEGAS
ncbi:MAG TPA: LD-carboxypeptidase [Polyangiaceae bacterium]|nr:LD-carboxypeptidase [Polyangiaceae bacterium]